MICRLCGGEIKRKKGQNQKAYAYELQQGAHVVCLRAHQTVLSKYRVSPGDYLNAIIEGMFLLFPELEETKSVRDYRSRIHKAEEEIEAAFPHLKKKEDLEKEVGEKEQEEGKEENANDEI